MAANLSRTLSFTAKENTYTMTMPTVGQLIAIETQKNALSNGRYSSMMTTMTVTNQAALNMIDAQAYLSVLCPQFFKDAKVSSLLELDLMDANEFMREVYEKQIVGWIVEWQKVFQAPL